MITAMERVVHPLLRGDAMRTIPLLFTTTLLFSIAPIAAAQAPDEPPAAKPTPPSSIDAKAKYSLPFATRPAAPPNLLRIDSPLVFQDAQTTWPSTITAGARVIPDLGIYGRIALVRNVPDTGDAGWAISNPVAFALYSPQIAPKVRLPIFAGVAFPIGSGGGDHPNMGQRTAMNASIYSRQAMDNSLFASNYLTPTVGAGIAWMDKGWTAQAEATVLELIRVKGSALDTDETRTNFTSGASLGYFIAGLVNVNVEMHYQRWLTTPAVVKKDSAFRDQLTAGGGVRVNVPLTDTILMRPGVGYFQGVDTPMTRLGYRIVQLDVPVVF
jgi:hypothetical protein